jgi:hypothetical protein
MSGSFCDLFLGMVCSNQAAERGRSAENKQTGTAIKFSKVTRL